VIQYLVNYRLLLDTTVRRIGQYLYPATTVGTDFNINNEYPLESLGLYALGCSSSLCVSLPGIFPVDPMVCLFSLALLQIETGYWKQRRHGIVSGLPAASVPALQAWPENPSVRIPNAWCHAQIIRFAHGASFPGKLS
jgi:hypothetical protein